MKVKSTKSIVILSAILFLIGLANGEEPSLKPKPFADGTRVAIVGDSITHFGSYPGNVELFYLTRFPEQKLEFFNIGIIGDTAGGTLARYDWDIAPNKPTMATVMLGMNDVGRSLYTPNPSVPDNEQKKAASIDAYDKNMRSLLARFKSDKIETTVITPSPFDDTSTISDKNCPQANDGLKTMSDHDKQLAREMGFAVIDFHTPMTQLNHELQAKDPKATLISEDRVHPRGLGHMVMTYLFLKGQEVPGTIASVSLDAKSTSVLQSENCKIDELKTSGHSISFGYLAGAIPFPIDKLSVRVDEIVPFTAELNREILKVENLSPGQYSVKIDDNLLRSFSADELRNGVNLAQFQNTPEYEQALQVRKAYSDRLALVLKLRALAQAEHQVARAIPHPISLDQMNALFQKKIDESAGKPWAAYSQRIKTEYNENKPREDEYRKQMAASLMELRLGAQPKRHIITITPAG